MCIGIWVSSVQVCRIVWHGKNHKCPNMKWGLYFMDVYINACIYVESGYQNMVHNLIKSTKVIFPYMFYPNIFQIVFPILQCMCDITLIWQFDATYWTNCLVSLHATYRIIINEIYNIQVTMRHLHPILTSISPIRSYTTFIWRANN